MKYTGLEATGSERSSVGSLPPFARISLHLSCDPAVSNNHRLVRATLSASRAYVYAVARACDRGEASRKDAAGCILFASERATQCALEALQALGGNGYINDYPTGRLLRDAKLYEIGAGTSEIRRMLIGRELFQESR